MYRVERMIDGERCVVCGVESVSVYSIDILCLFVLSSEGTGWR